jgi:hypothetical protein
VKFVAAKFYKKSFQSLKNQENPNLLHRCTNTRARYTPSAFVSSKVYQPTGTSLTGMALADRISRITAPFAAINRARTAVIPDQCNCSEAGTGNTRTLAAQGSVLLTV